MHIHRQKRRNNDYSVDVEQLTCCIVSRISFIAIVAKPRSYFTILFAAGDIQNINEGQVAVLSTSKGACSPATPTWWQSSDHWVRTGSHTRRFVDKFLHQIMHRIKGALLRALIQ